MKSLSPEANFFISKCFNMHSPRTINPLFNEKYISEDERVKYKFTDDVLKGMKRSGQIRVVYQDDVYAFIIGVERSNYGLD